MLTQETHRTMNLTPAHEIEKLIQTGEFDLIESFFEKADKVGPTNMEVKFYDRDRDLATLTKVGPNTFEYIRTSTLSDSDGVDDGVLRLRMKRDVENDEIHVGKF